MSLGEKEEAKNWTSLFNAVSILKMCMRVQVYVCECACERVHMCVSVRVCSCVSVYECECANVPVCMHMCECI